MSQCGPTDKRCTASTSDTSRSRTRIVPAGSNSQGQEHPFEGSSTHSNHLLSRRSLPPSRPDSNRTRAGAEQFRVPDHSAAGLHARGAIQGEVRDASDLVFHCASALTTKVRAGQAARVLPIVDVSRLGLWLARGVVRRGDRGGMRSRCASAGGRAGGGSARHGSGGSSCSTRTCVVSGQIVEDHMDPVAIRTALANRLQPSQDIARRFLFADHTPHRVVTKSLAVGQPPMFLMMVRPADRTIRAGVCHSVQRSRFGSAVLRGPLQHSCWNAPCAGPWLRSGVHGCDAGGEDQMQSEPFYESERRRAGGSCRP